jgi:hypothetical protein
MKHYSQEPVQKTYGPFSGSAMKTLNANLKKSISLTVHAALFENVKLRVKQKVRCMSVYDLFDLDELLGADFWAELDDAEKNLAGMCVGYLVLNGELPLHGNGFNLVPQGSYHLAHDKKTKAN